MQKHGLTSLFPPPGAHLQDLGQLLAALQLHGGLVDAIVRGLHLLRPLLQGGLEVEAPQAGFVLGHHQHLQAQGNTGLTEALLLDSRPGLGPEGVPGR